MSSACSGMDANQLRQSREYYNQLFGRMFGWYNADVHPYIYQLLCIMGVLANVCIIVVLMRPRMRKNPFNLFLIAIAICDMTLMATYFLYKWVEMCHPWYFEYSWIVFTYSYAVLSVFVHGASLWITVQMAVLRYLVLRSSASSSTSMPKLNTYFAASVAIFAAVIISLIGAAPNMLRYEIRDNGMSVVPYICLSNNSGYANYYTSEQRVHAYTLGQPTFWSCTWERLSFWTAGIILKLIPCLLLTIFMTLLVRMLMEARERRLRLCQRSGTSMQWSALGSTTNTIVSHPNTVRDKIVSIPNCNQQNGYPVKSGNIVVQPQVQSSAAASAERTTAMLTIIVAVFLVTELPQGILVMTIGVQPQLHNFIDLLSLLNSSVNFILYSTMSNLFRHEFLRTFGQLCFCVRAELCALRYWRRGTERVGERGNLRLTYRSATELQSGGERTCGSVTVVPIKTPICDSTKSEKFCQPMLNECPNSDPVNDVVVNGSALAKVYDTERNCTVFELKTPNTLSDTVNDDAHTSLISLEVGFAFDENGETVLC